MKKYFITVRISVFVKHHNLFASFHNNTQTTEQVFESSKYAIQQINSTYIITIWIYQCHLCVKPQSFQTNSVQSQRWSDILVVLALDLLHSYAVCMYICHYHFSVCVSRVTCSCVHFICSMNDQMCKTTMSLDISGYVLSSFHYFFMVLRIVIFSCIQCSASSIVTLYPTNISLL